MEKENLIISIIIVVCIAAAVAAYGITNSDSPVFSDLTSMGANDNGGNSVGNNTHTNATNPASGGSSSNGGSDSAGSGSSSSADGSNSNNGGGSNSGNGYSDWQQDYETGTYDADGNPIYRTVASTSGGQNSPGIYESYWSANGPISEQRIG